jgi:hypothetical protein
MSRYLSMQIASGGRGVPTGTVVQAPRTPRVLASATGRDGGAGVLARASHRDRTRGVRGDTSPRPPEASPASAAASARRREIRERIARSIEGAHILGEFQDVVGCVSQSDLNYLESVIDDLLRQLREA